MRASDLVDAANLRADRANLRADALQDKLAELEASTHELVCLMRCVGCCAVLECARRSAALLCGVPYGVLQGLLHGIRFIGVLYRLYIGITDGMSIARVLKMTASPRRSF